MKILRTLTHWHKPEWWELPAQFLLNRREKTLLQRGEFLFNAFAEGVVKGLFDYHNGRC